MAVSLSVAGVSGMVTGGLVNLVVLVSCFGAGSGPPSGFVDMVDGGWVGGGIESLCGVGPAGQSGDCKSCKRSCKSDGQ